MSRSRKKHPEKACRIGRKRCGCCSLMGLKDLALLKAAKRDAGRSGEA